MSIFLNFQYETINSDNFNESLNINCSILIILIPNILYSIVFRVLHWCANLLMDYFYCYHTMDKRHESQLNKQIRLTQVCISIHDYLKMFSPSIAHESISARYSFSARWKIKCCGNKQVVFIEVSVNSLHMCNGNRDTAWDLLSSHVRTCKITG